MSNSLLLFLQLASTCSDTNFPITNYSVVVSEASQSGSGIEEVGRKSYKFIEEQSIVMPIVVDLPQLMQEREYQVFVEACINITCRTTPSIPLSKCSASDTQCRCLSCTNTQTPCLVAFHVMHMCTCIVIHVLDKLVADFHCRGGGLRERLYS